MSDTDRHVRPFAEFLHEHRKGAAHVEMSESLNELVAAVVELGKPGDLTLKITVAPAAKGAGNVVKVTDKVSLKAPEADRPGAIFFADSNANLSRSNPDQPELPLRAVADAEPDQDETREAK